MQPAIPKPGRTASSSKPIHTTETDTTALPATGYVRLPVASAVSDIAKSTICVRTARVRSPSPSNCRRVQSMPGGRRVPLAGQSYREGPKRRLDTKPSSTRKSP